MPTLSIRREGNTGGCDIASTYWTCEVQDPRHAWNLHAREPGGPTSARHEAVSGPVEEGDEPQSRGVWFKATSTITPYPAISPVSGVFRSRFANAGCG